MKIEPTDYVPIFVMVMLVVTVFAVGWAVLNDLAKQKKQDDDKKQRAATAIIAHIPPSAVAVVSAAEKRYNENDEQNKTKIHITPLKIYKPSVERLS